MQANQSNVRTRSLLAARAADDRAALQREEAREAAQQAIAALTKSLLNREKSEISESPIERAVTRPATEFMMRHGEQTGSVAQENISAQYLSAAEVNGSEESDQVETGQIILKGEALQVKLVLGGLIDAGLDKSPSAIALTEFAIQAQTSGDGTSQAEADLISALAEDIEAIQTGTTETEVAAREQASAYHGDRPGGESLGEPRDQRR